MYRSRAQSGTVVKAILAVLSIVVLFAASIMSYAECGLYLSGACARESEDAAAPCHETGFSGSSPCHEVTPSGCNTEPGCPLARESVTRHSCEPKPDCERECHRMFSPPLVADGPSRTVTLSPDTHVVITITVPAEAVASADAQCPDLPPPRAVHEGIATTVLRI